MSKVFFDVGVSLDGSIAGPNRGPNNPLGDGGDALQVTPCTCGHFALRLFAIVSGCRAARRRTTMKW